MKIYAENRPSDLMKLLHNRYVGYKEDTIDTLQMFGHFHALAVYHLNSKDTEKALSIWSRYVAPAIRFFLNTVEPDLIAMV